jgi:hypothetical protein
MASLTPRNPIVRLVSRFGETLRFPYLFLLTAGLFVLDLLVPDLIPFADELLLGLGTLLLGSIRKRRSGAGEPAPVSDAKRRA